MSTFYLGGNMTVLKGIQTASFEVELTRAELEGIIRNALIRKYPDCEKVLAEADMSLVYISNDEAFGLDDDSTSSLQVSLSLDHVCMDEPDSY